MTLAIYDRLKAIGVEMDLSEIVEEGRSLDLERFKVLTAPNRAATGLGYARLLMRLLNWHDLHQGLRIRSTVDAKLGILDFTEHLIQQKSGFMTPRTFLYAIDYLAFGYVATGSHWFRAKRLADHYAKSRTRAPRRAPGFQKSTMCALESMVLDPFEAPPVRLAAGKLRLCIQASIRHDDLTNTPLAACEWVRKPGDSAIIGLRSRTVRGKTGQRLWVASLRGATEDGDGWLVKLMSLALGAQGASWRSDDQFGKDSNKDRSGFLCFPPTLEGDVTLVKEGLSRAVESGRDVGMTLEEIHTLRWHGAKSTMPSIMQHLGLKPLAVRFQGAWASQMDTMPDTHLREAQTLVLEAQERCLSYLRGGGDLIRLLGTPIGGEEGEGVDDAPRAEAAAAAMAAPARFAADEGSLALEFFDEAFTEQGWDQQVISEEVKSLAGADGSPTVGLIAEDGSLGNGPSSSESEASTGLDGSDRFGGHGEPIRAGGRPELKVQAPPCRDAGRGQ